MSTVSLENKTILVTGAAGFIGSNLVKRIYQEAPSATVIGIDPVHFGVVFVVWMCIGTITPPFGSDLFIACGVAKISAASAFKRIWPFVIIYVAVVVLIMAFPDLVTFLPKLLKLM